MCLIALEAGGQKSGCQQGQSLVRALFLVCRWLSFLLCACMRNHFSCVQLFKTLWICSLPGNSVHGGSPVNNVGVGCHASPGHLPDLGTEPRSPTLQADSLPSEPAGKPMNTGVGSLSLLQGIFPTQESNQGLLHWRQILYLSYRGRPRGK